MSDYSKYTAQELLDIAANGVLAQGRRSIRKNTEKGESEYFCGYRGSNNLKCAVGHIMRDEDYDPLMETNGDIPTCVRSIQQNFHQLTTLSPFLELLGDLQTWHDSIDDSVMSSDEFRREAFIRLEDLIYSQYPDLHLKNIRVNS